MNKQRHLIILGLLAVIAGGYYLLQLQSGLPSARSLSASALTAGNQLDRISAATQLASLRGSDVAPELKRVVTESNDADVVSVALNALAAQGSKACTAEYSVEYLPVLYNSMNHTSKGVRSSAFDGARLVHSGGLPNDLQYSPDDAPEMRKRVVEKLLALLNERMKPPDPDYLEKKLAAANVSETTGRVTKKEDDSPVPSPSPTAAPSPSQPPSAFLPPSTPFVPLEYPAVTLLVWMCRGFAVLMLIAVVAGALSLLIGQSTLTAGSASARKHSPTKQPRADAAQAAAAEDIERILARNNSTSGWSKAAILGAGAMSVIFLLVAAEMLQLHVRMQQDMSYLSSRIR